MSGQVKNQIRELEQVVLEKDELLKVLTERLELAAEQLDRLRRQGGGYETTQPTPTLPTPQNSPSHLVDDPAVLDDLRDMLNDWRVLQSRDWFGSLDERLSGINHLVSKLNSAPVFRSPPEYLPAPAIEQEATEQKVVVTRSEDQQAEAEAKNVPIQETVKEQPADDLDAPATRLELPDLPSHVDIEFGSTEELREGLRQREDYILRLRDYLLAYDSLTSLPAEDVDLSDLSPAQKAAVEAWEAKVRKELRQTQIQLWIERAQLSREQMQLNEMQHQLEAESKRIGITNGKVGAGAATAGQGQKNKNWLGMFGSK